jgi:large subunit ribosomal protein L21
MEKSKKFCIVDVGGKQIMCSHGDEILVDSIKEAKEGKVVEMKLVFEDGKAVDNIVKCVVLEPLVLGEKIRIFKQKRRKGYRKTLGFRAKYTKIVVGVNNG